MQHYHPLGGGSIFETTSLSFSIASVVTEEKLRCLSAAPLYVFWGRTHPFSVLLGCAAGQKPRWPNWDCLWWLDCGSGGCYGGGTWYLAWRPPGSAEHPCASAPAPVPGISTKLLTSSGGPRGQLRASMHDLVLNYCLAAGSFVWAAGSPGSALFCTAARAAWGTITLLQMR